MDNNELQNQLITIFKKWTQKPVLFIGSGISQRYKSIPSWESLLKTIAQHIKPSARFPFETYSSNFEVGDKKRLQKIADALAADYRKEFFNGSLDAHFCETMKEKIDNGEDIFLIYVASLISSFQYNDLYNIEKKSFQKLNDHISNIITTNYDTILEENFSLATYVGQEDMLNSRMYEINELYKIHGSIKCPNSIVLTSSAYDKIEEKQKYLSAKLLTLFIEYPIVFLGYSVNDPDILKILYDIKVCLSEEQLNRVSKQILFVDFCAHPLSDNNNKILDVEIGTIPMKKLIINDFRLLYDCFSVVSNKFSAKLLRSIKESLSQFIYSEHAGTNCLNVVHLSSMTDSDVGILIGSKDSIFKMGYDSLDSLRICEDVIFDRKYDPEQILKTNIPKNKNKFGSIPFCPLYKYLKLYPSYSSDPFIQKHIIKADPTEVYLTSSTNKKVFFSKNFTVFQTTKEIEDSNMDFSEKIEAVFFNASTLPEEQLLDFLKNNWERAIQESLTRAMIKKVVSVYDFRVNK